jgi:DNA-binding transcriptional regulator YiaG
VAGPCDIPNEAHELCIPTITQKELSMNGAAIRTLRESLGISGHALARELGFAPATVRGTEAAGKVRAKTEARYIRALGELAKGMAAERRREAAEAILSELSITVE